MTPPVGDSAPAPASQSLRSPFWRRVRNNFLTGIVVTAPIAITVYLIWAFIGFVDSTVLPRVIPLIPEKYNPRTYLPFSIPGVGVVIAVLFLTLVGAFAKNLFGRQLIGYGDRLLDRTPIVRSLYTTSKQIMTTIFSQTEGRSFQHVVLIEYPRKGLYAVAFMTTDTTGEIPVRAGGRDMVSVFLPTTPNPTSGYLLFVPRSDVIMLDMTTEEAAKLVISAGLVTPEWQSQVLPQPQPAPQPQRIEPQKKKGWRARLKGG